MASSIPAHPAARFVAAFLGQEDGDSGPADVPAPLGSFAASTKRKLHAGNSLFPFFCRHSLLQCDGKTCQPNWKKQSVRYLDLDLDIVVPNNPTTAASQQRCGAGSEFSAWTSGDAQLGSYHDAVARLRFGETPRRSRPLQRAWADDCGSVLGQPELQSD